MFCKTGVNSVVDPILLFFVPFFPVLLSDSLLLLSWLSCPLYSSVMVMFCKTGVNSVVDPILLFCVAFFPVLLSDSLLLLSWLSCPPYSSVMVIICLSALISFLHIQLWRILSWCLLFGWWFLFCFLSWYFFCLRACITLSCVSSSFVLPLSCQLSSVDNL